MADNARRLLSALDELETYFDERADAEYSTESASPTGNTEMRLSGEVTEARSATIALLLLLEGCVEALEVAAEREKRMPPKGSFTNVTAQKRLEYVRAELASASRVPLA